MSSEAQKRQDEAMQRIGNLHRNLLKAVQETQKLEAQVQALLAAGDAVLDAWANGSYPTRLASLDEPLNRLERTIMKTKEAK